MAKLLMSQCNDVFVAIREFKKKRIHAGICHVGLVF